MAEEKAKTAVQSVALNPNKMISPGRQKYPYLYLDVPVNRRLVRSFRSTKAGLDDFGYQAKKGAWRYDGTNLGFPPEELLALSGSMRYRVLLCVGTIEEQ